MATTRYASKQWRRNRLIVIAASGGVCALCGKPLTNKWQDTTVDHVIPVAFGGTDELSNLRAAHKKCNSARGVKPTLDDRPASRVW